MGRIGYHAAFASRFFLDSLRYTHQLGTLIANGGDILLFTLGRADGPTVSVHFIDSAIPLYEIRATLTDNGARGRHTLFMLWADMLLPAHGQQYRFRAADDWMEALMFVYSGSIYGYDVYDGAIHLFPVYFRGEGLVRTAEFGPTLDFRHLGTRTVSTSLAGLNGTWAVADFGGPRGTAHDPAAARVQNTALAAHYALFGLKTTATRAEIKQAYRAMARRLHPDTNTAPTAHDDMQRLNAAYAQLMAALGDDA